MLRPFFGSSVASRAFTTIELMVVVAVLAVLAALAGPSLVPMLERWRVRQAVEEMTSTFAYARSEAIRRGGNVTVRRNTLAAAECPGASGNGNWSCGWTVFDDLNGNGAQDSADETTLRVSPAHAALSVLALDGASNAFQVTRWGEVLGGGSLGFSVATLRPGSTVASALCVSPGGRIRAKPGSKTCA